MQHLEPLQGALESYCRRLLSDRNDVLDVLQSAIASAYRDFQLYAEGTNFRAWIFRYVHLETLNANRKHRRDRHEELPPDTAAENGSETALDERLFKALFDDPEAVLDHCEDAVSQAVMKLPGLERAALVLQALGEFKYREIAEILEVPIGTVMSALARARHHVREHLAEIASPQPDRNTDGANPGPPGTRGAP